MTEEDSTQFIAHVREASDGRFVIHELEDHLHDVAKLAGNFAISAARIGHISPVRGMTSANTPRNFNGELSQ